jgi:hypothetical protein
MQVNQWLTITVRQLRKGLIVPVCFVRLGQ